MNSSFVLSRVPNFPAKGLPCRLVHDLNHEWTILDDTGILVVRHDPIDNLVVDALVVRADDILLDATNTFVQDRCISFLQQAEITLRASALIEAIFAVVVAGDVDTPRVSSRRAQPTLPPALD